MDAERERAPRLGLVPFDSERKFMATLHSGGDVLIKGAPEVVLERREAVDGAAEALDAFAGSGMRGLAFAETHAATLDDTALDRGFRLLGLAALVDPPRIGAHRGGRLPGGRRRRQDDHRDHVSTAAAIAARFGLAGRALTGREARSSRRR